MTTKQRWAAAWLLLNMVAGMVGWIFSLSWDEDTLCKIWTPIVVLLFTPGALMLLMRCTDLVNENDYRARHREAWEAAIERDPVNPQLRREDVLDT